MADGETPDTDGDETPLEGGERTDVSRRGGVVHRATRPCARSVHARLRHLEEVRYPHVRRLVGSGFDERDREMLTYLVTAQGITAFDYDLGVRMGT